jgi:hypothetical protein
MRTSLTEPSQVDHKREAQLTEHLGESRCHFAILFARTSQGVIGMLEAELELQAELEQLMSSLGKSDLETETESSAEPSEETFLLGQFKRNVVAGRSNTVFKR